MYNNNVVCLVIQHNNEIKSNISKIRNDRNGEIGNGDFLNSK